MLWCASADLPFFPSHFSLFPSHSSLFPFHFSLFPSHSSLFPSHSSLFTSHFSLLNAQSVQSGKASYYAKSWTGRRTSNGERLHHDSLTCAHRSLPFGTLLKVTNLLNGKHVVVRVTDRGPFVKGRVVDLSWGAAKAIGMLAQGIAPVSVERVSTSTIPYKPEEDDPDVPKFQFQLADIAPVGITPVWQREARIDPLKVQHSMSQTAAESEADAQQEQ